MNREDIKKIFLDEHFGLSYNVNKLPADASFRSYERIDLSGKTYILMDAPPNQEEVLPFIKIGEFLHQNDFSVPEILKKDIKNGFLLLEDFGNNHYNRVLFAKLDDVSESMLYRKAVDVLVKLHKTDLAIDLYIYDKQKLLDEVCLLTDWYFQVFNGEELSSHLKHEYIEIWTKLLKSLHFPNDCLVLRDYHADNLMWLEGRVGHKKVGLLDFQDAIIGSVVYDMVSLLEDARRDISSDVVQQMINYYIEKTNYNRKEFLADYIILGTQRSCKILGVFARKALRDGDSRYLKLLPRVWSYIHHHLNNPLLLPLKNWFDKVSLTTSRL
jgi:aminoglycoside/choline kinase family phosphotransferase